MLKTKAPDLRKKWCLIIDTKFEFHVFYYAQYSDALRDYGRWRANYNIKRAVLAKVSASSDNSHKT